MGVAMLNEMLEEVQAYWSKSPCNSKRSRFPMGTLAYFTEIAQNKRIVEPHIADFAAYDKWRGKYVLELGCGLGTDAVKFAAAGALYTGIDISPQSLALARLNVAVNRVDDRCMFLCADMENFTVPTPIGGWDLVYAFGSIHHTPSPARALSCIRYYCSPWTELRIMLYHKMSWKVVEGKLQGDERTEAVEGCPVAYTYTKDEARRLVEDAGFEVTSLRVCHLFPYKIAEYVAGRYVRRGIFRVMPKGMFDWLESKVGWHILIKARAK
jgi:SAM-dependent methyltransferase